MNDTPAEQKYDAGIPLDGLEVTVDEVLAVMTPDERKAWDTAWLRFENVKLRQVIAELANQ